MAKISGRDIVALEQSVKSSRASARRYREKAGEAASQLQRTLTVAATTGGLGWLTGRDGGREWFGLPRPLWVGFGGLVLSMWDVGDGMSPVFANIGDGGIAAWAYTKGLDAGKKAPLGQLGHHRGATGQHLTDSELDSLVAPPV